MHLPAFPCRYAFTACGVSGGVYEFIKAHASLCFYTFRHENSAFKPFFFSPSYSLLSSPHPPPSFLPSWCTHLTLLNPLSQAPQGLLHATAASLRGCISVIVKGEMFTSTTYNLQSPRLGTSRGDGWLLLRCYLWPWEGRKEDGREAS